MGFLKPKMPAPPPPPEPPPPPPTVDTARQAQQERDKMLRRRKGRAATILSDEPTGELVERGDTNKLMGG
jgi:hypothetical protein